MTKKKIQEVADQLLEGQTVTIDDYKVKAVQATEKGMPCLLCRFFDSCTENLSEVCCELELYDDQFYRLEPVDDDKEDEI